MPGRPDFSLLGFAAYRMDAIFPGYGLRAVVVPYWFVVAVLAVAGGGPIVRYRRGRARRRRAAGLCARCGYDLRASPERCPEWGAAATH